MTTLSATKRTVTGKHVKTLRRTGQIPGVLYGHGVAPLSVTVQRVELGATYREAGESALVDFVVEGATPVKVLIKDVQLHPLRSTIEHVDFHQIRMDEKLITEIPLKFIGESPAVKSLGGTLIRNIVHLKVECLPQDLVHEIIVDISSLTEFNKGLEVKDLVIPKGLKVMAPADEMVVLVAAPRTEAELESIKGEVKEDVSQVVKVEKDKKEDDSEVADEGKKKA